MYPILFHWHHLSLPTFGVVVAGGLLLALGFSLRTARVAGLNADEVWDAGLFALIAAFVLSRVLLVVLHVREFVRFPLLLLAVPSLTWTGVALTGVATVVWLRRVRLPVLRTMDAWAPCAGLIWSALALGMFAAGTDPGMPTRLGFGIAYPGETLALHPVALYGMVYALLLTGYLWHRLRYSTQAGETFAEGLVGAGAGEFLLGLVRQPGPVSYGGLEAGQWVALTAVMVGGVLLGGFGWDGVMALEAEERAAED